MENIINMLLDMEHITVKFRDWLCLDSLLLLLLVSLHVLARQLLQIKIIKNYQQIKKILLPVLNYILSMNPNRWTVKSNG
jgi:hypothetical protein